MSYKAFNSFKRLFIALYNIDPDSKHIFGLKAELFVKDTLGRLNLPLFMNKILPQPGAKSRFIESDIILSSGKNIFCIEIKRLKGKVFFTKDGIIQENYKSFVRRYQGYRAKKIKNPIEQSRRFCSTLKRHLINKNTLFRNINFISIAAFSQEADISEIYSFENGILYIDDLIDFIEEKTRKDKEPYPWIIKELDSLKGFDVIVNRKRLPLSGFLKNDDFKCLTPKGIYSIPYSSVKNITIKRKPLLSSHDELEILFKDGSKKLITSIEGYVILDNFGKIQKHYLRNISEIFINSR